MMESTETSAVRIALKKLIQYTPVVNPAAANQSQARVGTCL
jgi:hypothetical protein